MSSRKPVIIAVVITAFVVLVGGGATAWALWPDEPAPAAAPTVTAVPAPTPIIDTEAQLMCAEIAKARILQDSDQEPAEGWTASTDVMDAFTANVKAETHAVRSTVPEIKAILAKETESGMHIPDLTAWCQRHGLIGS